MGQGGLLGLHPEVLRTFAERATEQVEGVPPPNCQMCKYRTQVLGFEAEVGAPQESHHHHVEGQGASAPGSNVADCTLCDDFCTGLCRLKVVAEPGWSLAALGGGHVHSHGDGTFHVHGPAGITMTTSMAMRTPATRTRTIRWGRSRRSPR
jgi:sirohydrochlorin cobaltochelatase